MHTGNKVWTKRSEGVGRRRDKFLTEVELEESGKEKGCCLLSALLELQLWLAALGRLWHQSLPDKQQPLKRGVGGGSGEAEDTATLKPAAQEKENDQFQDGGKETLITNIMLLLMICCNTSYPSAWGRRKLSALSSLRCIGRMSMTLRIRIWCL